MSELNSSLENFISQIYFIRGQRVMLDADLAEVYGTETKYVKRAVKRNPKRFPEDFVFELTEEEWENLKFQIGTSSWGGARYRPYAFTEHGAVMLASVLNTDAAVQASIFVVKAFVQFRNIAGMYRELDERLTKLEAEFGEQGEKIDAILEVIRQFVRHGGEERRPVGFKRKDEA